jgi:hypothetical protein
LLFDVFFPLPQGFPENPLFWPKNQLGQSAGSTKAATANGGVSKRQELEHKLTDL